MANVKVTGNAVVIKSTAKVEDIKLLQKLRPDALILKDEEGDPVFGIGLTPGAGKVTDAGISFSENAMDGDGFATYTAVMLADEGEDIKELVADEFGNTLTQLAKLEAGLPAVIEEAKAEHAALLESIEIG